MDNLHAYDAQANTVRVEDIVSDSNNRFVLERIKSIDNESISYLSIQNEFDEYEDEEDCTEYVPEGANDMGWMGYFIGKNDFLQELYINPFTPTSGASVRDVIVPFLRGVSRNKSIQRVYFYQTDLLGGDLFTMLGPFFKINHNLTNITIVECDFGDAESCRLFALAIGSSTHKSLQNVMLMDNNIADEEMVDIITALSMHPNLKYLDLEGNRLRKNGCVALATLLRSSVTQMQTLDTSNNEINDEGIKALLPELTNCTYLKNLRLGRNPSITTRGWQSFATVLESPNSNLREVYVARNNVDDEIAAVFANALVNNHTLHILDLDNNPSITAIGWEAFSKVLCNTSSVNATFLSNHTLRYIAEETNEIIEPLLRLNRRDDKKEIAVIKILQNHDDFDMLPFFEWEFKCLPLVLGWLERASEYEIPEELVAEPNIDGRKLSTIYQFVRGLPLLYVETRLRKELEDIKAKEKQMEEELSQEFKQRKQSIMRKLGQKVDKC